MANRNTTALLTAAKESRNLFFDVDGIVYRPRGIVTLVKLTRRPLFCRLRRFGEQCPCRLSATTGER